VFLTEPHHVDAALAPGKFLLVRLRQQLRPRLKVLRTLSEVENLMEKVVNCLRSCQF
jgi:hypothetical protein